MSTVDYASNSFITFTTFTIFHLLCKLFLHGSYISEKINADKSATIETIIDFVYFTAVIIVLGVVFPLTSDSAGKNGIYIWFPILGYLLFIGLYYLIKLVVPGWKAPFSNTFGYLFATIGAGDTIDNFFKAMFDVNENVDDGDAQTGGGDGDYSKEDYTNSGDYSKGDYTSSGDYSKGDLNKEISETPMIKEIPVTEETPVIEKTPIKDKAQLEISRNQKEIIRMVQTDRSLIINELTPENFSYFMELIFGTLSLQQIENIKNNPEKNPDAEYTFPLRGYEHIIKPLESIVIKKDVWAEFFWLALSGAYITSFVWSFLGNKPVNTIDVIEESEQMTNMEGLTNKTDKKKKKKEKTIASNISTFTSSGVELDKLPYVPG